MYSLICIEGRVCQLFSDLLWGIHGMGNSGRLRTLTVALCYLGGCESLRYETASGLLPVVRGER